MESLTRQIDVVYESLLYDINNVDHIVIKFISTLLYEIFSLHPILRYYGIDTAEDDKYSTLAAMNSLKKADYITPEELSNKLHIVLKKEVRTQKSKTYQFIFSTG